MFETACISDKVKDHNEKRIHQVFIGVEDGTDMKQPELRARIIHTDGTETLIERSADVLPYVESLVRDKYSKGGRLHWQLGYAIAHGNHQEALEQRYGREGAEQFRTAVEYLSTGKVPPRPAPVNDDAKTTIYRPARRPMTINTLVGYAPARA
ncbi:hypothetical protein KY363_02725 [Candidatus Woesearchaeota archaeon]|nr:hypothetical protein [Candidatus Woesearchaeota archaeon]